MSNVIELRRHRQGQKIIRAELVKMEGWKRRRWVVIVREPNGDWGWHKANGRQDAWRLAGILQRVQAKRMEEYEAMSRNELGAKLLSIPTPDLELMQQLIEGTLRLRAAL